MGVVREDMMLAGVRGGCRGRGQMETGSPRVTAERRGLIPHPPPPQKLELPPH